MKREDKMMMIKLENLRILLMKKEEKVWWMRKR